MLGFCSPIPTSGFGRACAGAARQSRTRAVERVSATRVTMGSNAPRPPKVSLRVRGSRRGELLGVRLGLAGAPLGPGCDGTGDDTVAVAFDGREHRAHQLLAEVVRLEPELA